ncbi:MAG: putative toxin-antitoxin system toxin component, PIN family [Oscillospiraceae bacterium]|jgi:putative PIN family toxin of toxin-antitoxin system|nr:putative toxin-antitoxin system toxin component, PIN family [Oscillospiraceae bacterium]
MKVVLDTNIVVSGFLSPLGKPAIILRMILQGDLDICFDTAILTEYEQVLCRSKFAGKIHQTAIRRFVDIISVLGIMINSNPGNDKMPDEADRKFFDAARTAGAVLITGNKKHFPDEPYIMTPSEFLAHLDR